MAIEVKVLLQGLGEVPATVELAIEKENPDVTYILCNEYLMNHIPISEEYTESSKVVVERAAQNANTKLVWQLCDIFDVKSVGGAISKVFKEINPTDEVIVNYTGGAASVKLLLFASAVVMSKAIPIRIIYSLRYKDGTEIFKDQTEDLKAVFKQLYDFF